MFKIIKEKSGCNLLIFGLGKDSHMWTQCNYDGKTTFLENDPSWITAAKNTIPDLDVRTVEYDSHGYDADDLLNEFKDGKDSLSLKLDDDIRDIEWDVVLVDAPAGYHPNKPGRMKSIYESFNLAKKSKSIDIFVHDCNRQVEKTYTDYFFKDYKFVSEIKDNQHGILRHYKKRGKNEIKTGK